MDNDTDDDGLLDDKGDANQNGRIDSGKIDPVVSDQIEPNAMPWIPLLLLDE